MQVPSYSDMFQVLLLQAADEGRGPVLFGDSWARAREVVLPFVVGAVFPDVYLEHPLIGDPFLDVTLLYSELEPGTRIDSPAAGEHAALIDYFVDAHKDYERISFGFELDTKREALPVAAVHFQPRKAMQLVQPFCEAAGEPARADLYLRQARRMPDGWPLSFFGMFRGRPGSPLRVCGYLDKSEREACANDPMRIAAVFDKVGFTAYDDAMLQQVRSLMAIAPGELDFQFDVLPDGSLGETFAIDVQFGIEQPEAIVGSFTDGSGARVMRLLEEWGVADGRWEQGIRAAFARSIPVQLDDGAEDRLAFTLMPQWAKARWTAGEPQPSKLYHLAHSSLLNAGRQAK